MKLIMKQSIDAFICRQSTFGFFVTFHRSKMKLRMRFGIQTERRRFKYALTELTESIPMQSPTNEPIRKLKRHTGSKRSTKMYRNKKFPEKYENHKRSKLEIGIIQKTNTWFECCFFQSVIRGESIFY